MTTTPRYLYGMHEEGGEHLFADAKGWIVFTEEVGHDANRHDGKDFTRWSNQGFGTICRINHGYGSSGTIPEPDYYGDFAARCANYVAASPGCSRWIVGNEPNHPQEWPNGRKIEPWRYADCFNQVAAAIHALPGHESDEVVAAAIAPWTDKAGDWIAYGAEMLKPLKGCGGIGLHAYTHGASPDLITSQQKMAPPYQDRLFEFEAYRQTLQLTVPTHMKSLPVYMTEMAQLVEIDGKMVGWIDANTGWVQAAYADIHQWNGMVGSQKIMCGVLYRWPHYPPDVWSIKIRQGVQNDLRAAIARGYEVPKIADSNTIFIPAAGTGTKPVTPPVDPLPPVVWDERLTARGIELTQYKPRPGEWYWRIVKGEYWEEKEHVFGVTLNEHGARKPGVSVRFWWADGKDDKVTELKPNDRWMVDFPMFRPGRSYGFKALDGPSDSVFGMGLGSVEQPDWNIHVSYHFTLQWTQAPAATTPPTAPPSSPVPTPRLKVGDTVYTGGYVNLRRTPGYVSKPVADVIHTLDPNTRLELKEGPRAVDDLVWWLTSSNGWVAENDPTGSVLITSAIPPVVDDGVPVLVHPIADEALRVLTQPFGVNEAYYKRFLYDGVPLLGHNGIDYGIPEGTPIRSVDTGRVLEIKEEPGGFGNHLLIRHPWGDSLYAHLSRIAVVQGQSIAQGEVIALSGNTGASSGPHLHFGLRLHGHNRKDGYGGYSDPMAYLQPSPSTKNIRAMSDEAAAEFDIDPDLLINLLFAENRFKLDGESEMGAIGPAQIMPDTFAEWAGRIGVKSIHNPSDNIRVGAAYLAWLIKQFKGDILRALFAYNWGIGNVTMGDPIPQKTLIYAYSIIHGAEIQKALRTL